MEALHGIRLQVPSKQRLSKNFPVSAHSAVIRAIFAICGKPIKGPDNCVKFQAGKADT
jgi:hypothetical protein